MVISIRNTGPDDASSGALDGRDLLRVIAAVRRRWRMKVALKGSAIVLGFGLVAFALSAWGMDHFRYAPTAIAAFRVFTWAALLGLVVRFLILPLAVRLPDERVALYIEEHDPSLQAALLSAVRLDPEQVERDRPDLSPVLARRLVERAVKRCQEIDYGKQVEGRSLQRMSGLFSSVAAAGMVAALLSPAFIRQAVPFLLLPWDSDSAESPYSIDVKPGHVTLARGADQTIVARLEGFDSDEVEVALQSGEGAEWERWPMTTEPDSEGHRFMLLDVSERTEYFVEAAGVRSGLFRLDVVDVPYVERIDLEYRFPRYTGLKPQLVEDGGDVAVLRGTEVSLLVGTTVPVMGGRLVVEGEEPQPLEVTPDGRLTGAFEVSREAFYRIELPGQDGTFAAGSPDYSIEVLSDQPPIIRFLKPGRDARVTAIEEVFTEVEVEDDFGVGRLELVFSVNGAPEEIRRLHSGRRSPRQLSVGHTFFLEEYELEPGDFVSYYARATDNRGSPGRQQRSTDIYFMEIRPFGMAYRQAAQGGGMGGGGGAGGTLSRQQRQIVAATFKLSRDRNEMSRRQFEQDVTTVTLMQGRLREQVENLTRRMLNRGLVGTDSGFGRTSTALEQAAVEMAAAEVELEQKDVRDALAPEQRALQHLQRAEAAFTDVQVAFGGAGAGGGGGGGNAEDLADLFELELDKLQNQYEAVQRGQRQQLEEEVDEAVQRLRELARRQEQEVERQRLQGSRAPNQGGGGGGRQRQLAEETRELGRRLERLAREHSTPGLEETARRLKEAADSMRRAGASGENGASQGLSALDRLKDARRLLEKNKTQRVERDMDEAVRLAQGLERQQERIAEDVRRLGDGLGEGAQEQVARLDERKDALAEQVEALEEHLDRMARETRRAAKEASRELREAAGSIRDNKLKEKIRYSKGVVRGRPGETAQEFEGVISADVAELGREVAEAASAMSEAQGDPRANALERTRDLVRRVESINERVQDGPGQEGDSSPASPGQQQGSQGQGQQQGGSEGQAREGQATADGRGSPGGGRAGPGTWGPDSVRQLRREFRERAQEAQGIGSQLSGDGGIPGDLREIERKLRQLERSDTWGDPKGVEQLVAEALEDLKMFEYALRRELEGTDPEKLRLSGSTDVPEGWRRLVEEYYRSLSQGGS